MPLSLLPPSWMPPLPSEITDASSVSSIGQLTNGGVTVMFAGGGGIIGLSIALVEPGTQRD